MTFSEIFADIVSIMQTDSATCRDMGAGPWEKYQGRVRDDMAPSDFVRVVREYLATFGLAGHLTFWDERAGELDFRVRRWQNALYVTEAAETSLVQKGDRIIALDGASIPRAAEENAVFLLGETEERQGHLWPAVLRFVRSMTVERSGEGTRKIPVVLTDWKRQGERYSFSAPVPGVICLRLKDFGDETAIRAVYDELFPRLDGCRDLILDVRGNTGGSDTAFFPLLPYVFPAGHQIDEFLPEEPPMEINYSERNCRVRRKLLDEVFSDGIPEDIRPVVERMRKRLTEYASRGFVAEPDEELGIFGRERPDRVWVLTDELCASTGDAFVKTLSASPKVTVAGRPTMGITDYSNCAQAAWDDFRLVYPTSRSGQIDMGEGLSHRGVPVDVYIPWTPESLERDVEMEIIMGEIEKRTAG